jgi:GTPase SAR1 family protein
MVRRSTASLLSHRLRQYPAVALVGARQSGKTTLARSIRGQYFDLEQPGGSPPSGGYADGGIRDPVDQVNFEPRTG